NQCLTDQYIAYRVYLALGSDDGNSVENALYHVRSPGGATTFDPSVSESIYGGSPFNFGIALFHLAPTMNFHGVYLGTDKIGHIFQQGYEYYEAFNAAREDGATPAAALRKAVTKGIGQEHGICGEAVDVVYANGDRTANPAGLR